MQDVFVSTDKIAYLKECLTRYNGSTGYLVLYFAALIFILIKGTDKEKKIFIPMSILMLITVYNPIFPHILCMFADINSEYYRFFWMSPVIVLVPYVLTKLIICLKEDKIKNKKTVIILAVLILACSSKSVFASGMSFPENRFKMPNELIEISEIIHGDSGNEYAKAFFEFEYNMQIRQYDAKMLLTVDREDYIYAMSNEYTQEMIDSDEFPQYRIVAALFRYQDVDTDRLLEAFESTKTEYIVLTTGSTMIPELMDAGLTEVAKTKGHTILKYNLADDTPFELIDYSDVYRQGL